MISNKELNPVVNELLPFMTQSHFKVPTDFRQNSTNYLITKMTNKNKL